MRKEKRLYYLRWTLWLLCAVSVLLIWLMVLDDSRHPDGTEAWKPVNHQVEDALNEKQNEPEVQQTFPVNINEANSEQLQWLPGIGPSKSEAIIQYRETNGHFATIEDLKKVKGIGPVTFEDLKDKIVVKTH